jgi:hypothetical protein
MSNTGHEAQVPIKRGDTGIEAEAALGWRRWENIGGNVNEPEAMRNLGGSANETEAMENQGRSANEPEAMGNQGRSGNGVEGMGESRGE